MALMTLRRWMLSLYIPKTLATPKAKHKQWQWTHTLRRWADDTPANLTHPCRQWCKANRPFLSLWRTEWPWFPPCPAATLRHSPEMTRTTQRSPASDPHSGTCRPLSTPGTWCCLEAKEAKVVTVTQTTGLYCTFPRRTNSHTTTELIQVEVLLNTTAPISESDSEGVTMLEDCPNETSWEPF